MPRTTVKHRCNAILKGQRRRPVVVYWQSAITGISRKLLIKKSNLFLIEVVAMSPVLRKGFVEQFGGGAVMKRNLSPIGSFVILYYYILYFYIIYIRFV